jgi:hypothetical protein
MEQAAVLMMQRVVAAELQGRQRVIALVLGPVHNQAEVEEALSLLQRTE